MTLKQNLVLFLTVCVSFAFFACSNNQGSALNLEAAMQPNKKIKNIIVMIPDGMSSDGISLARWFKAFDAASQTVDPSVELTLDELVSGYVRTWWSDGTAIGAITDSAPAATAFATGVKTNDKFIGVTPQSIPVATVLEAANLSGKATGLIATSNIQHATPAGFSAHYNDRSRYDIIGEQQVYNGVDVVLGGGSMYLTPPYRRDNENLIEELRSMEYQFVTTKNEMNAISSGRLWGMFAADAMAYEMDRLENTPSQPSLAEMTAKAIELLSKNKNGFFLMVEGSKVDWAAHANDPIGLISDIIAFDDAVKTALDFAKASQDTMIIIMSDHGNGGITIGNTTTDASYSKDPIQKFIAPLAKATLTGEGITAKFDENRTNITAVMERYYGITDLSAAEIAAIRATPDSSMNYTAGPIISQRAALGWTTGGHTGEETLLFTYLPGNSRIVGTIDNTDVAKIIAGVWKLDLTAATSRLYNDAEPIFTSRGASVVIDNSVPAGAVMTATKGGTTLEIPENKNFVLNNGQRVNLNSVIVYQSGKFYVPQEVISLLP